MAWVIGLVWGIAVFVGVAVLGLCAFDLAGKTRRLHKDVDRLLTLQAHLDAVARQVADAQRRLPSWRPA